MQHRNARVALAAVLKTAREEVCGLFTDAEIVERANVILVEDARHDHAVTEKTAKARGVRSLPFAETPRACTAPSPGSAVRKPHCNYNQWRLDLPNLAYAVFPGLATTPLSTALITRISTGLASPTEPRRWSWHVH